GVAPLATVVTGVGNGDGTEGVCAARVIGTYLHGPVLVRNPGLADLLLTWAAGPLPALRADDEEWTQRLREQRLRGRPPRARPRAPPPPRGGGGIRTPAPASQRRGPGRRCPPPRRS